MKHNHTDITVVLDESGSMAFIADDTVGGFDRFVETQKKAPGTAALSLVLFNSSVRKRYTELPINSAPRLTDYNPNSNTALFDAVGQAITDTGRRLAAKPESERADKVVIVIITDGDENSSREYNRERIFEMIQHQKNTYSWEFVFLGANQDAMRAASQYGIPVANSMTYAHTGKGATEAFNSVASNLAAYRSCVSPTMSFTDDDRAKQFAADPTNTNNVNNL